MDDFYHKVGVGLNLVSVTASAIRRPIPHSGRVFDDEI